MSDKEYILTAEKVSFRYSSEKEFIFQDIDLNISRGSIVAITGKSGQGKTTLCYLLSGIIPRVYKGEITGNISLFGENVSKMKAESVSSKLGIVFQDPETQLFMPEVEDELAFAPENFCFNREEIDKRITGSLRAVGMENFRHHETATLSGGQKQLAAIASVLTMNPDLLIFDEITAQVDKRSKQAVMDVISSLKNENKTVIMVDHDITSLELADEVYHIQNHKLSRTK
ncbi:MAG: ABC transporter ATP-binding protein [Candidatus Delongbacteria bacterium]|nr:ABC transporter ATP-binding protein [Candidatus Delongbacteria bacterium]